MADSDLLITISGAALSLLFYENVRSCGDQMGFLIGQTLEFSVKTYTDSDNQIETIKTHNNIEAVITCPLPELLHDSLGRINKEKLKDFMRDKSKQVIGWFRFRRNTGLLPTLRDKLLHREFASHFSGGNGSKEEFFVTCLLNASTSNRRGMHKFKHVFLRRRKVAFEPVPVRINNLGNESTRGSDYKPIPIKRSLGTPDVFTRLIESLNLDLMRTSGVESAISIQKAAEQYLNELIPQLCKSDLEVAELEKQVKEFKLNRMVKMNGSADKINRNEVEEDHIVKGQKLEKISPSKIESPDIDDRPYDHTSQELRVNTVSEIKVNLTETVSRNRRSSNRESEIVKESICKSESIESGAGRGRRHECHPGMRKTLGRTVSIPTRSSERSQTLLRQESETNCMQNTSLVSYSQMAQKKVDLRKSNSTDNN